MHNGYNFSFFFRLKTYVAILFSKPQSFLPSIFYSNDARIILPEQKMRQVFN